ncbi:hypothetical protein [Pyrodictium abyssi]|uniref:Uncharacterized protein n=1 Tax=Pyrodictium abyssi TaxID=54256 RepID=A0ABM8IVL4_9CREN|nr:hypothetical protein PABY_11590 [Pyrodictium abyssi]
MVDQDAIAGYLLRWRGPVRDSVHLWGRVDPLLEEHRCTRETVIQLYDPGLLPRVLEALKPGHITRVESFLDMAVGEEDFTPYRGHPVVRLSPSNPGHVEALARLLSLQGPFRGKRRGRLSGL